MTCIVRTPGDFASGTVSRWTSDTIFLIERLITKSPVILVGSGVGGWISLLVASKRPDLVVRMFVCTYGWMLSSNTLCLHLSCCLPADHT